MFLLPAIVFACSTVLYNTFPVNVTIEDHTTRLMILDSMPTGEVLAMPYSEYISKSSGLHTWYGSQGLNSYNLTVDRLSSKEGIFCWNDGCAPCKREDVE